MTTALTGLAALFTTATIVWVARERARHRAELEAMQARSAARLA